MLGDRQKCLRPIRSAPPVLCQESTCFVWAHITQISDNTKLTVPSESCPKNSLTFAWFDYSQRRPRRESYILLLSFGKNLLHKAMTFKCPNPQLSHKLCHSLPLTVFSDGY